MWKERYLYVIGGIKIIEKGIVLKEERRMTRKAERIAEARKFTLFSDAFMSVVLQDIPACQHVLRILTGIVDLIVKEVITQYSVTKVTSHSARLDVMAEDEKGKLYNIEIQRRDCVDHARRTRFYGAMIDSEFLEKGKSYEDMPDVYIIYISETDIWKAGKTKYVVEKHFSGTDMVYEDGIHILYVNAAVYDGTETAKMMEYFKTANPGDTSQGDLSRRVMLLKCEKEGEKTLCEITDRFIQEGIEEGIQEGIQEGRTEKAKEIALALQAMGMPTDLIAQAVNYSEEIVKSWLEAV